MPRCASIMSQADIARTIRAAKQAGAGTVEIRPDGTMLVHMEALTSSAPRIEQTREIVL